jgi:hypothetical protein
LARERALSFLRERSMARLAASGNVRRPLPPSGAQDDWAFTEALKIIDDLAELAELADLFPTDASAREGPPR